MTRFSKNENSRMDDTDVEFLSEKESNLWKDYEVMTVGELRKEWYMSMDETRRLLRVPTGWIYTLIRGKSIESTFIPGK